MFLISFKDILNGSFTIHKIQPDFNDATMSRLEYITDILSQNSRSSIILERFQGNFPTTYLSACEADFVPVLGNPAEMIFILLSLLQWFYINMTHQFTFW